MWTYFKKIISGKLLIFIGAILFLIIMSLDGIGAPYFLGQFTDYLYQGNFNNATQTVIFWLLFLLVIVVSKFLFEFFLKIFIRTVNYELKNMQSKKSFLKENLSISSSTYITAITSEILQIENKFIYSMFTFILCLLQGTVTFLFLMHLNVYVGLVFTLLGILPALIPKLTEKWIKESTAHWQKKNKRYVQFLTDFLDARPLIKRFGTVKTVSSKLNSFLLESEKSYFQMGIRQSMADALIGVLYVCALLIALILGIYSVQQGHITVGNLITIYMAGDRVMSPLIGAASTYNVLLSAVPILDQILKESKEVARHTGIIQTSDDTLLTLEKVTMGYDHNSLIQEIDFSLDTKSKILFKAPSGSGKSTFIRTILDEIPLLSGTIRYGSPLGNESFAVVSQTPFIFDDTLLFNLTFDYPIKHKEIFNVLERVGLPHLASEEKLLLSLSKSSNSLSGGELKRLEVARALLFEKPGLLVDEALSGLDEYNAKILNDLIKTYPGAVIDIEHHLSDQMLSGYNQIVTIKEKRFFVRNVQE